MGYRDDEFGRGLALSCDKTTTGARLISSLPLNRFSHHGFGIIRKGDKTTPCPACGKEGQVGEGEEKSRIHNVAVAVDRCLVICGCPPGSNRIIAPVGQWLGKGPSPEKIARDKHAAAAAARKTKHEEEEKRLADERECNRVFAKSCLRGDGCNDAGDEREPHTNFAIMGIFRAAADVDPATEVDVPQRAQATKKNNPSKSEEIPKPKERSALYKWFFGHHEEMDYQAATAAAAGTARAQAVAASSNVLELIGGRTSTYGTWALRAAGIATAGAGASVAGFLMGMMPGKLNEGEQDFITPILLQQIAAKRGTAPTRVRFTWENDSDGNLVPRGWHTPHGEARVRQMEWDSKLSAYTFTTEDEKPITIIWTPDHSGVDYPHHTGNQERPVLPDPTFVDPMPESSDIVTLPGHLPEERHFLDYILYIPVEGVPPVYIYLSKKPETPIWTKTKELVPVSNAYAHWLKHSSEFSEDSFNNAKEYVDSTHDFVNNPPEGTLTKTRANGDRLFYHPETNTFAVRTKDGVPKTMFKPDKKIKYWSKQ